MIWENMQNVMQNIDVIFIHSFLLKMFLASFIAAKMNNSSQIS